MYLYTSNRSLHFDTCLSKKCLISFDKCVWAIDLFGSQYSLATHTVISAENVQKAIFRWNKLDESFRPDTNIATAEYPLKYVMCVTMEHNEAHKWHYLMYAQWNEYKCWLARQVWHLYCFRLIAPYKAVSWNRLVRSVLCVAECVVPKVLGAQKLLFLWLNLSMSMLLLRQTNEYRNTKLEWLFF